MLSIVVASMKMLDTKKIVGSNTKAFLHQKLQKIQVQLIICVFLLLYLQFNNMHVL